MPAEIDAPDLLNDLVAKAKAAGADAADAVLFESAEMSAAQRLGRPERLERSESVDLGLRVFMGRRQAVASSTDQSPQALAELVERAVAMARAVPEDPYCGLAEPGQIARDVPDLDICDPDEPAPEALVERARRVEEAALAVDGVTNSEAGEAGWAQTRVTLAASNGFAGGYRVSRHSVVVSVLAGNDKGMERDYEFSSAVYGDDLESPEDVGRRAGERAVRRLGARKARTARVPVVYDPRVANGLLRALALAVNGSSVARGTSYLRDRMETRIFPEWVTVVDDPLRPRGLRSAPFDGEGVRRARRNVVERGVLRSWLLDLRSARQLGLATTGHAARGPDTPPAPAPSNLYLEPGPLTPAELIDDIGQGFYVTEMMGFGLNPVTGDYSRGAAGFWIENGELAYPVSEMTIAGNVLDMFMHLSAANDLVFRYGTDAPTLRVEGMTVAGR